MNATLAAERKIVHRTRGHSHGPVTRLMSPGDLGQHLKPFVFLDIVSLPDTSKVPFGLHPHSGIATITILTDGDASFDDGEGHSGIIGYGGVEWMRAGRGVWHGQEMNKGTSAGVVGFQLWLALPAEMELERAESQYLEASHIPQVGPARVIVGHYEGQQSPVRAPSNINYLVVTLQPGETWCYDTPSGHSVGWMAVSHGELALGNAPIVSGEMVVFDDSDEALELRSTGDVAARFVIASATPHPHELHLGHYSVHTSAKALAAGEAHIADLHHKLIERERKRSPTANGSVPILR